MATRLPLVLNGGQTEQLQSGDTLNMPPSGTAGGDLSGTYPNPGVVQVNGAAVPASKTVIGTDTNSRLVDATSTVCLTGDSRLSNSRTPSGAAGGDLSGTYPNPGVVQVNGASVPASKTVVGTNSSGQIVDASSSSPVFVGLTTSATTKLAGSAFLTDSSHIGTRLDTGNAVIVGYGGLFSTPFGATQIGFQFCVWYDSTGPGWTHVIGTGNSYGGAVIMDGTSGQITFFSTTDSGANGTAAALVDQLHVTNAGNLTVRSSVTTGAPTGGTAGAWKGGIAVTTTGVVPSTTKYIQLDIGGVLYKLVVAA